MDHSHDQKGLLLYIEFKSQSAGFPTYVAISSVRYSATYVKVQRYHKFATYIANVKCKKFIKCNVLNVHCNLQPTMVMYLKYNMVLKFAP